VCCFAIKFLHPHKPLGHKARAKQREAIPVPHRYRGRIVTFSGISRSGISRSGISRARPAPARGSVFAEENRADAIFLAARRDEDFSHAGAYRLAVMRQIDDRAARWRRPKLPRTQALEIGDAAGAQHDDAGNRKRGIGHRAFFRRAPPDRSSTLGWHRIESGIAKCPRRTDPAGHTPEIAAAGGYSEVGGEAYLP